MLPFSSCIPSYKVICLWFKVYFYPDNLLKKLVSMTYPPYSLQHLPFEREIIRFDGWNLFQRVEEVNRSKLFLALPLTVHPCTGGPPKKKWHKSCHILVIEEELDKHCWKQEEVIDLATHIYKTWTDRCNSYLYIYIYIYSRRHVCGWESRRYKAE